MSGGLVPLKTNATPAGTLFGAGGGGGGGVNPVVSSITFAPNVGGPTAYTQGVLNMSTQLVIQDFGTPVQQDFIIQTGFPTPTDFTSSFVSTTNCFIVNGPGGDGNNGGLTMNASADGRSMITSLTATSVISSLAIIADPVVIPFNLQVSSINGAAPGGSAGPNPQVSTLSVNDTGNITLDWNNGGGTLNFGFEATNTSSFIIQQGIGVSGTKVAGPEGCLQALEKDGGANQVFAPLQASGFEVCATAYPGGAFAGLYFSSIGSVLYSAVGQPLTIDAPAGVSVSSLSVSSINGAAPGGGNAYPLPSTLKSGESTGLSLNASSLTTLAAWSTISSHFYTVSVDLLPKQLTQTFGPTDAYQTQLTTDNGVVNILNNGLWSEVSTLYNAAIQLTPGLGGSATFKAGGTFMTLDVLNTSVLDTLSTNLNGVYAVDHGPGN